MTTATATQIAWALTSPLDGQPRVQTQSADGVTSVLLVEQAIRATLLIAARAARATEVVKAIEAHTGIAPSLTPSHASKSHFEIVWSGPEQWLVTSTATDGAAQLAALANKLSEIASCSDQSHARVILRLSGHGARRTLMKVVGIDVHPTAFPVGAAAMTPVAHMPSHLWRRADADGAPVYEIAGTRSTAGSLWRAIVAAAAELGLDARPLQAAAAK